MRKVNNVVFPKNVEKYVKLQHNDKYVRYSKDPMTELMDKYINKLQPKKVLELGSGIGRASVYFFKKYNWTDTVFYLVDGDSGEEQISSVNYNSSEDFYNSMKATKEFCEANGLFKYILVNVERDEIPKEKFDLVYSTYAIGFHWPVSLYLEKIQDKLEHGSLLLFIIRGKQVIEWNKHQIDYIKTLPCYDIVSIDSHTTVNNQLLVLKRNRKNM
jgi:SAM-dependent methyltransferase